MQMQIGSTMIQQQYVFCLADSVDRTGHISIWVFVKEIRLSHSASVCSHPPAVGIDNCMPVCLTFACLLDCLALDACGLI